MYNMTQVNRMINVEEILGKEEGQTLEFKRKMPRSVQLASAICAFANADGGTIVIGIDDKGAALGLGEESQDFESVMEKVRGLCLPPVPIEVQQFSYKSKEIGFIVVPRSSFVHSTRDGRYLIRVGSSNRPLTPNEILPLLQSRYRITSDNEPVRAARLENLQLDRIQTLARDGCGVGPQEIESLLLSAKIAVETQGELKPTLAGILVFGKDPQQYVPQSRIQVIKLVTSGEVIQTTEFRGTIPEHVDQALSAIEASTDVIVRVKGFKREDVPRFPLLAVREFVVNALIHRDYNYSGSGIQVILYPDRFEVLSPGGLPAPLDHGKLLTYSYCRNPVIMDLMHRLGYAQGFGIGLARTLNLVKEKGYPEPTFSSAAAWFTATCFPLPAFEPDEQLLSRLSKQQRLGLEYTKNHDRITNRVYQGLANVSRQTAARELKDLVEKGGLVMRGKGKGTYYTLRG